MNKMEFTFGSPLPACADKIKHLFPKLRDDADEDYYLRDAFWPDMTPVNPQPDLLYPYYANGYLHANVPSTYLDIMPEYRKTAALAAIDWIKKLLPAIEVPKHFDGQILTANINGEVYRFCYPCMDITYIKKDLAGNSQVINAIVVPIPDVTDNDDDWVDSIIPSHVLPMVKMMLWCYHESARQMQRTVLPAEAYVVRICGNTPGDITIRTVLHDRNSEEQWMRRICSSYSKSCGFAAPETNYIRREQQSWFEKKNAELDDAYYIDDPAFYQMLCAYMDIRQVRKENENKSDILKNEMDAIAIKLASMTKQDSAGGKVVANGNTYSVVHTKRRSPKAKISAVLVRQFYPELQEDCIATNITPRGRVTIDML